MMLTLTHQHWGGCGCIRVSFILQMIVVRERLEFVEPARESTLLIESSGLI